MTAPAPPEAARTVSAKLDEPFMAAALALGARHLGRTWPNPSVGALVVAEGPDGAVILGRGITQPGGRPHAEPLALAMAGEAARGATLYVALEPCSHQGRTPPCAEAVIAAGIARVVSAMEDPDPRVVGRGHALLRQAGIAVTTGVLREEARAAHRGHILRVTQGRAALTLKLARTADGYAGRVRGGRLLITGEAANAGTHLRRAHADAVMVGVGTVLADDPLLTVRLPGLEHRSPLRVVLDTGLRTPPGCRLAGDGGPTWLVAADTAPSAAERALLAAGVQRILRVPLGGDGRLCLAAALRALAAEGLTRVFCEGGPTLADALARADLVDEVLLLTAARRLGEPGIEAVGPHLAALLADRTRLKAPAARSLGADTLLQFERIA